MKKYQNKYRITSHRAQWWDYGDNGLYFITICTKNRKHFFGEIADQQMHLSNAGILADILWHEIKHHCNVETETFQVMPNHIHGILSLVETGHALSLRTQPPQPLPGSIRFQNPGKNTVSSIIGSYKSAVTKHANRFGLEFGWQPNYHDHIIRDEMEYASITDYIIKNVANWKKINFIM